MIISVAASSRFTKDININAMKNFFVDSLSNALNAYLRLDSTSKERIALLDGKIFSIELLPFHFVFHLYFLGDKIEIKQDEAASSDAKIIGTPLQLASMMMAKENRNRFFAEDLIIEGNAELGQQVTDLFDEISIDYEELLSHLVGDVPAFHLHKTANSALTWLKNTGELFAQNINEYTHEEIKWFPAREALQDFFNDIDAIRMDVDRIEAKIMILQSQFSSGKDAV